MTANSTPARMPAVFQVRASGGLFGADRVVLDLSAELPSIGYRPVLVPITESGGVGEELTKAGEAVGITVRPLPMASRIDWRALARLRDLATAEGASILHGHDYKANLLIHLARVEGARRVATLHGRVGTDLKLRFYESAETRIVRNFDRVICVSETMRAAERARGLDPVVIHNGIDLTPFRSAPPPSAELRQSLGLPADAEVVGSIGRLSAEKGFDFLLGATARLVTRRPGLHVVLVGDGPEHASLAQLAADLGVAERVHFAGLRHDAPALYRLFDVFCMTSRREGLPLALLEALASGCASVVTPVGGIPEVVGSTSGEGGEVAAAITVAPGDVTSLASILSRLLDDAPLRARLGAAGRARVETRFSRAEMARRTAHVYDELLGRRKGGGSA